MPSGTIAFDAIIQEIQEKLLLSERIGRDVRLTRKGHEFLGLCPFHDEKTPSFTVNDQKGFYHCFGCGAHGSLVDYVMHTRNLPFKEALTALAQEAGVRLPAFSRVSESNQQRQRKAQQLAVMQAAVELGVRILQSEPSADLARQYLAKRGVMAETVRRFQLGFCDGRIAQRLKEQGYPADLLEEVGLITASSGRDRFAGRLLFPILAQDGKPIGFGGRILAADANAPKYLNSPETPLFHKGGALYNLFAAREHARKTPLIVVEGYMDVVAMAQYGFPQTVAALGTALTETHIPLLWRYCDHPILCFDGDTAGRRASVRAAMRALPLLQPGKTLFFCYMPDGKDPDDFLRSSGADAMRQLLDAARPLAEVAWESLLDPYQDALRDGAQLLPEEQAALKRSALALASSVTDPDIQRSYRDLFMDRYFSLIRQMRSRPDGGIRRGRGQARTVSRPKKDSIFQRILLGILLKVPILLEEVNEQLAQLNFDDPKLDRIRDWLLDAYFAQKDMGSEEARAACTQFFQELETNAMRMHAPFLFQPEEAIVQSEMFARWLDIWQCTIDSASRKADWEALSHDMKEHFGARDWERMKAAVVTLPARKV